MTNESHHLRGLVPFGGHGLRRTSPPFGQTVQQEPGPLLKPSGAPFILLARPSQKAPSFPVTRKVGTTYGRLDSDEEVVSKAWGVGHVSWPRRTRPANQQGKQR
jgi:hypothetical protein